MTQITDLVKQTIDLHLHVGPEIIPRRYTARTLVAEENGNLSGAVLKNHFSSTASAAVEFCDRGFKLYGGLVLNRSVGGLNPEAIRAAAQLSNGPIIVWLPTISAANFLSKSEYEIPPEWVDKRAFRPRKANTIQGISVIDKNGIVTEDTMLVLKAIRDCKAVLATGHISAEETMAIVPRAIELGIKSIIVTHPIYQRTRLTVDQQRALASQGCFLEQCFSMISIDKIDIREMVAEIKAVGPESIFLSSDVGQPFSPPPSEALLTFAKLLVDEGIPLQWIRTMLVKNPRQVLKLAKDTN